MYDNKESMIGVVGSVSGLCNTIKTLVSVMRFYPSAYGTNSIHLLNIFDNLQYIEQCGPNHNYCCGWQLILTEQEKANVSHLKLQVPNGETNTQEFSSLIDLQYENIPSELLNVYIPIFRKVLDHHVKHHIRDVVTDFSKDWNKNGNNIVSMQVRTWIDDQVRKNVLFREQFFISQVEALPKDTKVFLSSDSAEFNNMMISRFPGKIFVYPRRTPISHSYEDRNHISKENFEDTMIELLLLAQNKTIIGSTLSTFTEVAYYFSKCIHPDEKIEIILEKF